MKIGIIGECMIELFDRGDGTCQRGFGGDTLNTAIYLSRCAGDAIDVHYVTALGDDPFSEELLASWQAEGLFTDTVERLPGRLPGLYLIRTDAAGERSFFYWRDRAPARKLFQTPATEALERQLGAFDWLYYSAITLAVLELAGRRELLDFLAAFRSAGGKVAFDSNYRPRLWPDEDAADWLTRAYRDCDLAMPSIDDEFALWGEADPASVLARLSGLGCTEIVLKRGADSCLVSIEGALHEYPVEAPERVIDTTAAGDSFNAGYLATRLIGGTVEASVGAGQMVARQVIAQRGAVVRVELPSNNPAIHGSGERRDG